MNLGLFGGGVVGAAARHQDLLPLVSWPGASGLLEESNEHGHNTFNMLDQYLPEDALGSAVAATAAAATAATRPPPQR